jgi:catechol 2,3-dioxygenase-like lactoylglutathione lyase family enzyme
MAVGPLSQVHVSVTDLDRAIEFYRDVLGVPFLFRVPGQEMAFLQSGQVRLYLGVAEAAEFRSHTVHYFRVDDIEAERARLAGLGVEFRDEPHLVHRDDDIELWMTFFTDPDGHQLVLMEERAH